MTMQELMKYLLLLPLFLFSEVLPAQDHNLLKNFLTVEDGLSNNEVTSIVQDHDGFIWIGTRGGLNRYDGYGFKIFNQVPGDSNSLVNPSVEDLFVDSKGNIWIGTKSGGISKYDPVKETFTNIEINFKHQSTVLPDNRYLSFYEGKDGKIWMGSYEHGLFIYDQENNSTQQFLRGSIDAIFESRDGRVWVGSSTGLFVFDPSDYSHQRIVGIPACTHAIYDDKRNVIWSVNAQTGLRKVNLSNNKVTTYHIENSIKNPEYAHFGYHSLLLDENDLVWMGTWGTGFYTFDPEEEAFQRFLIYPDNRATLNKDYDAVLDIFQDRSGNIWLGTNGGGLVVLTKKLRFNSIGYHPRAGKGLPNTRIMSVVDDRNGNLWLGTIGSGLYWSPDRENFYKVANERFSNDRFFIIKYIYEDSNGRVWVGSNNNTFFVEFENGKPKLTDAYGEYGLAGLRHQAVSFVETERLFMAGLLQGGLLIMDKENNYSFVKRIWKEYRTESLLKSDRISALLKDSNNRIWAGTYNGLHVFNERDTTLVLAGNIYTIKGELTGNIITTLDEDQFGNIWIGTPNGLNCLSPLGDNTFEVTYFTEKDGLASNFIKGISHDESGNIWMSTNVGISKLSPNEGNRVVNFNESDGVRGKNFTEASVYKNKHGELFFGGSDGITFFHPEMIEEQKETLKPVFTNLSVLNKAIEAGDTKNKILESGINHAPGITLSYRQNNFEIGFSALDYHSMGRNNYRYKLENHDKEWQEIGQRRFVNFNNLRPGEYKLLVAASNSHNYWGEEPAQLLIEITPPFWQTIYALLFYIVLVVGIVSIIRWNAVKQVKLANSLDMEKMQHEQDQKLNEIKLRFFTNLSHEFRTPLTLIMAPLKELIEKKQEYNLGPEAENKVSIIQNNSKRLMKLVNQLLDFRKVESGNMKLYASKTNLEEFLAEVCHPFTELARINNIRFDLKTTAQDPYVWVDRDKLEVVLNNLISNAFKAVEEEGRIEVTFYEEEDQFLLSVADSGRGIPETEIQNIFDRFYRVGVSNGQGSSGIGLALAKRYMELHKGSISVVSKPNEHTEFTLTLLKGTDHLQPDEIVEAENREQPKTKTDNLIRKVQLVKSRPEAQSDLKVLIVEDNQDVREYLISLLGALYQIQSAENGAEGCKLLESEEKKPDLILSDVMMPKMDGFEFCKQVKADETTATIPFVFLTAKSDEQFRLLGARLGADDFISKPFDPNLVVQKIKNLLESREKLQKKYSRSVRLEPSDIEITSEQEVFVEKAIAIIEENLQNDKFTSDVLASEMNMSNSSLYRKLKALTGFSTAEFIRSIRIKRSAQLLADRQRTITEIAYEVGFNDVKHFRAVFQKQFKCTPSQYREKL